MEIKRDSYLKQLILRKNNGLVKVITGIRRCGKSYLLNIIFYSYLKGSGVDEDHIIRFAFDADSDISLLGLNIYDLIGNKQKVPARTFSEFINLRLKDDKQYYLLLDEVQLLESFEFVLNSFIRKPNVDIYVTGSNSKFLSSDVITEFAGRGDVIHLFPLNFNEFNSVSKKDFNTTFSEYLVYGGLPALTLMETEAQKSTYLKSTLDTVYLRDIVNRYGLKDDAILGDLLNILASGISSLVNPNRISKTFLSVAKKNVSPITIANYIKYFEESFLVKSAIRYDVKGRKYINTPYKIYFEDLGIRNARINFRQLEETHLLENLIYNELRFRGFEVDVGVVEVRNDNESKQYEIDFVANLGSKRYYIQSAFELGTEEKISQETRSFDMVNDSFKKILIVRNGTIPLRSDKGYTVLSIKDFLLNKNSLDL